MTEMLKWDINPNSMTLTLAGGLIVATVRYSMTRGRQYEAAVNRFRFKRDFPSQAAAQRAAEQWIAERLQRAAREIGQVMDSGVAQR
jgi:hypothetical protein